jgi:hypothetical protein
MGSEDLAGKAAFGLTDPGICDVDIAAEVDNAVDIEAGAEEEAGGGDNHAAAAGVIGACVEDQVRMVTVEVIAFAAVHDGKEESVPGFDGAGEEGQKLVVRVERGFRGGFVVEEADGAPGIGGQAIAIGAHLAGGADFPAEGTGGTQGEIEGFRGGDLWETDAVGGGEAGFSDICRPVWPGYCEPGPETGALVLYHGIHGHKIFSFSLRARGFVRIRAGMF